MHTYKNIQIEQYLFLFTAHGKLENGLSSYAHKVKKGFTYGLYSTGTYHGYSTELVQ